MLLLAGAGRNTCLALQLDCACQAQQQARAEFARRVQPDGGFGKQPPSSSVEALVGCQGHVNALRRGRTSQQRVGPLPFLAVSRSLFVDQTRALMHALL